jgi:hypothetical protein
MKKEHNYVDCQRCDHWDDNYRREHICTGCNNTRKVIDPREILCNLCGESVCPIGTTNEQYPHGLYNAQVVGGYDSYHLFDMTRYTFSFCEKCLRQLFIQCKIKPVIDDLDFAGGSEESNWERDQRYYEFNLWKDNGGHHQAYINGKCNAIKDCSNKAVYTRLHHGNKDNEFTENCCCEEHKELHSYVNSKLTKFIPNVLKPFL